MEKLKADKIITEYLEKIYGFAIKKSFSYDEAEEISAEIVKEVYVSLLKADYIANLDGYIWRIGEHTYAKYVSQKKKHEGISIDNVDIPFALSYDQDFAVLEDSEEFLRLRREIAYLTKKRREIVYSFYYENKSISFISRSMGIPEGTVKWHLNKAKKELKEKLDMERKIGKLGLNPLENVNFSHGGKPGSNSGPEFYLGDKINLNIVYSVYHTPKTKEEIAEELGLTLVFIEDRIEFLEENGFLVHLPGDKFTTYVCFRPAAYSIELQDKVLKKQLEIAEKVAKKYAPAVREAIKDVTDVYIPGGNKELLDATAIFYGIFDKVQNNPMDISKYLIKTTAGGEFIAFISPDSQPSDPDYKSDLSLPSYWTCGYMTRGSDKYPCVYSWSVDSRYCSREGAWQNNLVEDYEYLYEYVTGAITDTPANAEKISRLRERKFITDSGNVNIMMIKGNHNNFFEKIPNVCEDIQKEAADSALEYAMLKAKSYPPQMQDLIVAQNSTLLGNTVAMMALDILYGNGTFKELTENEKVTANLVMFSDTLPNK